MFRQFYAEQDMADPRDSWYKPNLLYNIHYRPPKPPTPPKMMVVTREFNPSICTCGEHGCVPHYRMERDVVWSNSKVRKEYDRESKELKERNQAERDVKAQKEKIIDVDDDSTDDDEEDDGDDAYGEDKEDWKSEECAEDRVDGTDADGEDEDDWKREEGAEDIVDGADAYGEDEEDWKNEECAEDRVDGADAYGEDEEDWKSEECAEDRVGGADDYGEDEEKWKSEECAEDRVDDIKSKGTGVNVTEVGSLPTTCLPRSDDLTKKDKPEPDILGTTSDTCVRLVVEDEEFGSAFGIMSVYCDSELHTWKWKNEICYH